jgi:glycosyltransferase involved in cell wall biosynthesis
MIHVDGNHDTNNVMQDVRDYIPLLRLGGICVIDDINWDSVKPALAYASEHLALIYSTETYAVLINSRVDNRRKLELQAECQRLETEARVYLARSVTEPIKPRFRVSVSMITYNQEVYIERAIESALEQVTDFDFEIVIGEDKSTDSTLSICKKYQSLYPEKIRLIERDTNIGGVKNYLETYKACKGTYVAFLEGDDFWIDQKKLQKQADFLDANLDYAICFHNVLQTDHTGELGAPLFDKLPDTTTVRDLCTGDYISTPSCMIRNGQVKELPEWVYSMPGCDWVFDILNAECGKIKYMPEAMAAYRSHSNSMWSSLNSTQRGMIAINLALELNMRLDFRYDKELTYYISRNQMYFFDILKGNAVNFQSQLVDVRSQLANVQSQLANVQSQLANVQSQLANVQSQLANVQNQLVALQLKTDDVANKVVRSRSLVRRMIRSAREILKPRLRSFKRVVSSDWAKLWLFKPQKCDLVIVDDAYPHPQSAFRLEEYDVYLTRFRRSVVLAKGLAFNFFNETRTLPEVIRAHENENPRLANKISVFDNDRPVGGRLAYCIFAGNAWSNIEYFERNNIKFVFTLYPGGSFLMNDHASDARLRRVFGSPMFRRVIVTQKITLKYLIDNKFCAPEKIDFIYGVVTPKINLLQPRGIIIVTLDLVN